MVPSQPDQTMNALTKILLAALVVTVSLCTYMYSKYREVVEWNEKRYILEMGSGRVWEIGETLLLSSWNTALDGLVPWGTPPLFVPNGTDAQLLGKIVPIEGSGGCRRLVPEQMACTVENPVGTDGGNIIVDYGKYAWSQAPTPFAKIVEAVKRKVQRTSDDPSLVLSVRAAVIHLPADEKADWRVEEVGPAIAFQGKGAAYFARVVGIVPPNIWECYER